LSRLPADAIISCRQLDPEELAEIRRTGRAWISVWGNTYAALVLHRYPVEPAVNLRVFRRGPTASR
jgi:hypothetical protein